MSETLITGLTLTFFPLREKIKGEGLPEIKRLRKELEKIAKKRGFEVTDSMVFMTPQLRGYLQLEWTKRISRKPPKKARK